MPGMAHEEIYRATYEPATSLSQLQPASPAVLGSHRQMYSCPSCNQRQDAVRERLGYMHAASPWAWVALQCPSPFLVGASPRTPHRTTETSEVCKPDDGGLNSLGWYLTPPLLYPHTAPSPSAPRGAIPPSSMLLHLSDAPAALLAGCCPVINKCSSLPNPKTGCMIDSR